MSKRSQSTSPRETKKRHSRQSSQQFPKNSPSDAAHSYTAEAVETWVAVGKCASTLGALHIAVRAYDTALMHSPGSLAALIGWSSQLRMTDVRNNETVGSQASLQRLTAMAEQYPDLTKSAAFFKELTECYLLVNLNDLASQAILQALQLQSDDPSLYLLQAQTFIRLGLRAEAATALSRCLSILPSAVANYSPEEVETARSAHAELAAIAAADGNVDLSISELTATLSLPPPSLARIDEHIALWCALATAMERANKIPEALDACDQAERAVGPSPRILITHAYLLLLNESPENAQKAVEILTRAVEAEPHSTAATEGENGASAAAEDGSGDFLPWCLLGKAYTLLDSPRAAYDSYQIALRRADASPITWLAVGKLYLELKQLPDALAAYSQALRLQLNENSPGTAAAWDGLSCVYERCDDQLGDAADACSRAALCFRSFGDSKSSEFYEKRAKDLRLAAKGAGPVPELSEPVGVPNYFLRDLVTLLPSERIALVQGINKDLAKRDSESALAQKQGGSTSPPKDIKDEHGVSNRENNRSYTSENPYSVHHYGSTYDGRPSNPYDPVPRGVSVTPHTPPPGQPQYGPPLHPGQGVDRGPEQPMYAQAYPYKPDSKSPMPMPIPQVLPQSDRPLWQGQQQLGNQPQHMLRGPPPMSTQYGPPLNGMMSPSQMPPGGHHRSPMAAPQAINDAYQMPVPPGYVYGQYVPVHGGVLAQVQPYGAANWRR